MPATTRAISAMKHIPTIVIILQFLYITRKGLWQDFISDFSESNYPLNDAPLKVKHDAIACLEVLHKLPKPLMFVETKTTYPFQLIVADPKTDTMISQFLVDHGAWDMHVLKAIEMVGKDKCRKGNMAMDVGANLGFFTNAMLSMGCQVTSFEMQPNMAQRVMFSACSNGKKDRLTLHVGAVGEHSGMLKMVNAGSGNLGGIGITEDDTGISVQSQRIDSLMDPQTPIVVMKLDIEGYEDKALNGMANMFENKLVQNIVMEFTPTVMGVERAAHMLEYLHSFGFTNITELDFMEPSQYSKPLQIKPVDTTGPAWAREFSEKIVNGGDARGLAFTDLLLRLSPG